MRSVSIWTALELVACAVPAADVQPAVSVEAIDYAAETDVAIDRAIVTGQSVARDADKAHQEAIEALQMRDDAAERVVARAEGQDIKTRQPYVQLLSHVGQNSDTARRYLLKLALAKPAPAVPRLEPEGVHTDDRTDHERSLGQAFLAVWALAEHGDTAALSDVYSNAEIGVARTAAATAARKGLLSNDAIQILSSRGIGGTFAPLSMDVLTVGDATLGPSPTSGPVEGPQ